MHDASQCKTLLKKIREISAQHDQLLPSQITLRKAPLSKIDAQHFVETLRFLAGSELDDNTLIKFEKSDFVTCPNCGSQNNLESKPENCYQCGTSLLTELMDDGIYLVDLTFKHEHIV